VLWEFGATRVVRPATDDDVDVVSEVAGVPADGQLRPAGSCVLAAHPKIRRSVAAAITPIASLAIRRSFDGN
jgi:hypothetical protein